MRKRENKNYSFDSSLPDTEQKMTKKKAKKLENTIMASFVAKIVWKSLRKIENNNYRFVPFLPDALQKIPKKQQKKFKKHKKIPLWLHFKLKSAERG